MNLDILSSLEDYLRMSFQSSDDGDAEAAKKYYDLYLDARNSAFKIAQEATVNGDVEVLDKIIKSINSMKDLSDQRSKLVEGNVNQEYSLSSKDQNIEEDLNSQVRDILSEFSQQYSNLNNEYKNQNVPEQVSEIESNQDINNKNEKLTLSPEEYYNQGLYKSAEKRARQLIRKNSNDLVNFNWLGASLGHQKRFKPALEAFQKITDKDPNNHLAIYNQAQIHLRMGEFKIGWEKYDAGLNENLRCVTDEYFIDKREVWDGKPFKGTLIIYSEQGIGDQLMHGTLINDLMKIHSDIAIKVDYRLIGLFSRTFPSIKIFPLEKRTPDNLDGKKIAFGSLCKFLRSNKSDFENSSFKKYLVDENIAQQIKSLMPNSPGLNIGISWFSFARKAAEVRNFSPRQVSRITETGANNFINLQYGDIQKQIYKINSQTQNPLYTVPGIDLTMNIEAVAAIIENCDLIISIDNSTAHLAASLGKPVWMPLPYWAEMRWMEKTENSPWYQNLLLLRQKSENEWENVLNMIEEAFK